MSLSKRSYKHDQPFIQIYSPISPLKVLSSPITFSPLSLSTFPRVTSVIRTLILTAIFSVLFFITCLQEDHQGSIEDFINYADLEEEVQSANPVLLLTYKSPFDENLFKEILQKYDSFWKLSRFNLRMHKSDHTLPYHPCQNQDEDQTKRYSDIWRNVHASMSGKGLWHERFLTESLTAVKKACVVQVDLMNKYDTKLGNPRINSQRYIERNENIGHENYEEEEREGGDGWVVILEGGQKAFMRIVWEFKGEMKRGGLCSEGFEMATSEIASFHVQRLLGLNKTPLVVGRRLNVLNEIIPNASPALARMIHVKKSSSGNQTSVLGRCRSCHTQHIFYPVNNIIETSLTLSLNHMSTPLKAWQPSTSQSYMDRCKHVSTQSNIERHADIFELTLFNILIGKPSSSQLSLISSLGRKDNEEVVASLDNSRSFCDYNKELNLDPLIHCCKIRKEFYDRLKTLNIYGLSKSLKLSLQSDELSPVLCPKWHSVLDARFHAILNALKKCISNNGAQAVLMNNH